MPHFRLFKKIQEAPDFWQKKKSWHEMLSTAYSDQNFPVSGKHSGNTSPASTSSPPMILDNTSQSLSDSCSIALAGRDGCFSS